MLIYLDSVGRTWFPLATPTTTARNPPRQILTLTTTLTLTLTLTVTLTQTLTLTLNLTLTPTLGELGLARAAPGPPVGARLRWQ